MSRSSNILIYTEEKSAMNLMIGKLLEENKSNTVLRLADVNAFKAKAITDIKSFKVENHSFNILDSNEYNLSKADICVLMIDCCKEISPEIFKLIELSKFFRVSKLIICFNKIDLVAYSEEVFTKMSHLIKEKESSSTQIDIEFIPLSCIFGDNIKAQSEKMPWYQGPTLHDALKQFSTLTIDCEKNLRLALQTKIHHDGRSYYGAKVLSGDLKIGQKVKSIQCDKELTINRLYFGDRSILEANSGNNISFTVEEDVELSESDLLFFGDAPCFHNEYSAAFFKLAQSEFDYEKEYLIKKNFHLSTCKIKKPNKTSLSSGFSSIENISLNTKDNIAFDSYIDNKGNGKFILIDPNTNKTIGAGIIHVKKQIA